MFQKNAGLGKNSAAVGPLEALKVLVPKPPKIVDFAISLDPAIKEVAQPNAWRRSQDRSRHGLFLGYRPKRQFGIQLMVHVTWSGRAGDGRWRDKAKLVM
jgi:hypothetical protein